MAAEAGEQAARAQAPEAELAQRSPFLMLAEEVPEAREHMGRFALAMAQQSDGSLVLLALNAQLKVTQNTAASRAEALRIAEDKPRVGYISQLQVTPAQSEYEAVLQSLPQLQTAIARQYNALRLLTGELPDTLPAESARPDLFAKLQLPPVPVALPSELLRRRPDLAQAESLLAASDASLQASRAAFLPQVSLSASLGSLYINALNYNPASVWSLGGSVLAPRLHTLAGL